MIDSNQPNPRRQPSQKPLPHPPHRSRRRNASSRTIRREISAGGVAARQEEGQWLVALLKTEHKRGEVWVLPKGHVELKTGERIAEAGRREVQEEAGLSDLSVQDELGITRYTFQAESAVVRKKVHYFLMLTQQKQLTPQADEGILAAEWMPIDKAVEMLEYETDKEIVRRARQRLVGAQAAPVRPHPHRHVPHSRRRRIRVHT